MKAVSSADASNAEFVQLIWVKNRCKQTYELIANGPIVGSLQSVSFWKRPNPTRYTGPTWLFRKVDRWRTVILQKPYARPVATFSSNLFGGGTLSFVDGEQFRLVSKGLARPGWLWVNAEGRKLVAVSPSRKHVRWISASAELENNSQEDHLSALIMLSWHQILRAQKDFASTVAVAKSLVG